jgi:rhodanese-related sulfurtransferase
MIVASPRKAAKFFSAKMNFTTGPVELKNMIERGEDISIVDVRSPEDYAIGHIPGAVNLPEEKWDTFAGLTREKVNIIYCYSEASHLAASAALAFAEHGYPVMELEGGFETWKQNQFPVES